MVGWTVAMENQSERRSSVPAKPPPETVTDPRLPETRTDSTRPPSAPSPLRDRTVIELSVPTPKACPTLDADGATDQSWNGDTESPASDTAGKLPPAVQPPVEELYSADTGLPDLVSSLPAVSDTA